MVMFDLNVPIDYTQTEPTFDTGFEMQTPDKSYCKNHLHPPGNIILVSIDGFKSLNQVSCGIFLEQLNIRLSLVLSNYCNIFQAKVRAIKIAVGMTVKRTLYP